MKTIRIGTRGSRLALAQTGLVAAALQTIHPNLACELVTIKTTGDRILDAPLSKIGDKGLFTREIENEILAGRIDAAVHSMKDLPTLLPHGLKVGAVPRREDPRDVFISRHGRRFADCAAGCTIATGSLRRQAQIRAAFPGVKTIDIRGNIHTRLAKMNSRQDIDGIILARAGMERLGMTDIITETFPPDTILPAVGQGALAIEIRADDLETAELIAPLDDSETHAEVACERSFLAALGGGCQVPIAALARASGDSIIIDGMVASLDGSTIYRGSQTGNRDQAEETGRLLALRLLEQGAKNILEELYGRRL